MTTEQRVKQHDNRVPVRVLCADGDGIPVDLTAAASVALIIRPRRGQPVTITAAGDAHGAATALLTSVHTAATGTFDMEVEVTWPDTTKQTFPSGGYLTLRVVADLNRS